jgi:hypothetical protein
MDKELCTYAACSGCGFGESTPDTFGFGPCVYTIYTLGRSHGLLRTALRTRTRTRIPAHAQAHTHARTHWQLGKADRAWEGWCPAVCVPTTWRNVWRCAPFLVTLSIHIASVEATPAPQLGAHMRQPRRCLRVCRPRVTPTPSRVQATTRSNTRSLRRRPLVLTLPVPVRWARSLRMTERPVNHGGSRGSIPPLAPTRAHVHARVQTYCPVTRACVRCRHPSHAGGEEYSGIVFLSEAPLSAHGTQRISRVAARSQAELTAAALVLPSVGAQGGFGDVRAAYGRSSRAHRSRAGTTTRSPAIDQCRRAQPPVPAAPAPSADII